ncbi:unnamed protein product [Notodromas monacha]|uniref:Translation initiation factor eIF2B subunit alpha n=1 Tax=Notodromas monacha TaxID=399045 RepID=A0A7R9GB09_9CRUS|nr:unnamed protein product [Notodromas monacha]CAG0914586.1 unnamed protein product [Notodromas monacha]
MRKTQRMTDEDIAKHFVEVLRTEKDPSDAIAAIKTVIKLLESDESETFLELSRELNRWENALRSHSEGSVASIISGFEQIQQHMTKKDMDRTDMSKCRKFMIERGKSYLVEMEHRKCRIAEELTSHIADGMSILTHSRSKNVFRALKLAMQRGKRFKVYVTESMPDKSGHRMARELTELGIPTTEILDASIGYIMEKVDLVLVGAEGVVENGGIINKDMSKCRKFMIERGKSYLVEMEHRKCRIAEELTSHIADGMSILTHSRSKNVFRALKLAMQRGKRFKVYVTESMPDKSGHRMASELTELGIPTTEILDASIGYIMEKVDLVLVGAEGVVENGGIINKVGTYGIGLVAKALKKPVYVLCESFKFVRLYPLNQSELPAEFKYPASVLKKSGVNLEEEHPLVDYTPPHLITFLFTDLGTLVPSAVSDTLIKLYL